MDDVVIDAPYAVTSKLVASLNIAEVLHGTLSDGKGERDMGFAARYKYPIEAGIFNILESPSNFMVDTILQKIQRDRESFEAKFERKMKAENDFYKTKYVIRK